jgi:tetrathionate reductase subunit B
MISRRDFIRLSLLAGAGAGLGVGTVRAQETPGPRSRWVFLVDTMKCVGCGLCVKACKLENEVPYDLPVTRTWVERYVITGEGQISVDGKGRSVEAGTVFADTPMGARDGYKQNVFHNYTELGSNVVVPPDMIAKSFFVPKLCNQCDKPPCVQVCPVGATFKTADGVVLVDRTWCIGCGYCIMACPYGVRFFHPVYRVAEKCTWCYHRIVKGMKPACVMACPFEARRFGEANKPDDPVAQVVETDRVAVLKPEFGTRPLVYYLGLDENVR